MTCQTQQMALRAWASVIGERIISAKIAVSDSRSQLRIASTIFSPRSSEVAIESGIEMHTINVERRESRNSSAMSAVSPAAISALRTTSLIDSETKID